MKPHPIVRRKAHELRNEVVEELRALTEITWCFSQGKTLLEATSRVIP